MPGDNAAPPTHRRAESIVCTSLVLLSSPALPRRAAKNEGEEPENRAARGGGGTGGGEAIRECRDLTGRLCLIALTRLDDHSRRLARVLPHCIFAAVVNPVIIVPPE